MRNDKGYSPSTSFSCLPKSLFVVVALCGLLGTPFSAEARLPKAQVIFEGRTAPASPTPSQAPESSQGSQKKDEDEDEEQKGDRNDEGLIPDLIWITGSSVEVELQKQDDGSSVLTATLEWKTKNSELTFVTSTGAEIQKDSRLHSHYRVTLEGETTNVTIMAVDSSGSVQTEQVNIELPSYSNGLDQTQFKMEHPFVITPFLGLSYIEMDQPGSPGLTEWGATLQVKAAYFLRDLKWSLGASGWITTLPFASSRSNITAHVLEGEVHITREVPWPNSPWDLSLSTGLYAITLLVSNQALGFQNVGAFELFPELTYDFKNGEQAGLTFKYLPIFYGLSFLTLDSRILNVQLEWKHSFAHSLNRALTVGLDWTDVRFQNQFALVSGAIHFQSVTLMCGYHW